MQAHIIRKTRKPDEVNFRRTVRHLVVTSRDGRANPWEILDILRRAGISETNSGRTITAGQVRQWLRLECRPVCDGSDWWTAAARA